MRPRMTIISRVASCARCGLTLRSWNKASCLRRKRFSAASARRDRETSTRKRTRSHATKDSVLRLCVSSLKMEPGMNAQLYTLRDVTRLPTGGRAKFLRTTPRPHHIEVAFPPFVEGLGRSRVEQGAPPFSHALLQGHRAFLEALNCKLATINQRRHP